MMSKTIVRIRGGQGTVAYNRGYGLVATASELAGRRLKTSDVVEALGLSNSAYYAQREDGRLLSADNLLKLAESLDINPVELLLHYDLISTKQVAAYALAHGWSRRSDDDGSRYPLNSRSDAPPI